MSCHCHSLTHPSKQIQFKLKTYLLLFIIVMVIVAYLLFSTICQSLGFLRNYHFIVGESQQTQRLYDNTFNTPPLCCFDIHNYVAICMSLSICLSVWTLWLGYEHACVCWP